MGRDFNAGVTISIGRYIGRGLIIGVGGEVQGCGNEYFGLKVRG